MVQIEDKGKILAHPVSIPRNAVLISRFCGEAVKKEMLIGGDDQLVHHINVGSCLPRFLKQRLKHQIVARKKPVVRDDRIERAGGGSPFLRENVVIPLTDTVKRIAVSGEKYLMEGFRVLERDFWWQCCTPRRQPLFSM